MKKNIDKKALYNKIMEAVIPEVKKAINEDWQQWLKNNPSGFDHHDPEQTDDFDSLYTSLMDAVNGRIIDFVKADGEGVTLDTVVDNNNLRIDVIYPDGTADTNAGTIDLEDVIADEDDLRILIDLVNDYSEDFVENSEEETAEEFLTEDTLTENKEENTDQTTYEIASRASEEEFIDLLPNYVTCNGVDHKFQKTFVYIVQVDNDDVEDFKKWLFVDDTIIDWRIIKNDDKPYELEESVDDNIEDDEDDKDIPKTLIFWDHNYGEITATRCFNPDYNTDKSYWECADEDGTVLCEIWSDTADEDELSIEFEKEMEMHDDDLWYQHRGLDDDEDDDEFDLEDDDEFEDYEYEQL